MIPNMRQVLSLYKLFEDVDSVSVTVTRSYQLFGRAMVLDRGHTFLGNTDGIASTQVASLGVPDSQCRVTVLMSGVCALLQGIAS